MSGIRRDAAEIRSRTLRMAPVRSKGITTLETDAFILRCFQTLTGLKFVVTADKGTSSLDVVLNMVYELPLPA